MSTEDETRKLLQIRENLKKRIEFLEGEIKDLHKAVDKIDSSIVEQGFQRPKVDVQTEEAPEREEEPEGEASFSIKAKDGAILGNMVKAEGEIIFAPTDDFNFSTDTPPFSSFMIERVLVNMRTTDEERAANGEIEPEEILEYDVFDDDGTIKSIIIKNYGGERRFREIRSSLRWTFDKMYETIIE
ncbi:MAG: hypothetical protein ACLFVP_00315 [Candidatus Bathyarchaeia archaeon]